MDWINFYVFYSVLMLIEKDKDKEIPRIIIEIQEVKVFPYHQKTDKQDIYTTIRLRGGGQFPIISPPLLER